jgi:hypothetical protein
LFGIAARPTEKLAAQIDIIFVSADHFLFYVISMFALNTVYIKRFYDRDLK